MNLFINVFSVPVVLHYAVSCYYWFIAFFVFYSLCIYFVMSVLLQVYYLPLKPIYNQNILPTVFTTLPVIRYILLREKITVVHGHSVCYSTSFCICEHVVYVID